MAVAEIHQEVIVCKVNKPSVEAGSNGSLGNGFSYLAQVSSSGERFGRGAVQQMAIAFTLTNLKRSDN